MEKVKLFFGLLAGAIALVGVAKNAIRSNHWIHWFPDLHNMGYKLKHREDEDNDWH